MEAFEKHLNQAIRFLSRRNRSEKEIRENLLKKKAPSEIIDNVVVWLKERKFLNDEEFASWWIEQRLHFRPKGIRVIRLELKQKGIAEDIIDKVTIYAEREVQNDLESAKKLIMKKIEKVKGLPKQEIYHKLGGFLARRGFDWETIKKSIDDALENKV